MPKSKFIEIYKRNFRRNGADSVNGIAYRLVGHDKEWIWSDGINNSTRYTHLPPGDYCFEIKYSENGNFVEENKQGRSNARKRNCFMPFSTI